MDALPPSEAGLPAGRLFPLGPDATPYRKLAIAGVSTTSCDGRTILRVAPRGADGAGARGVPATCRNLLRPGHLAQLRRILDDPEASANDRFVAVDLLKNANIAAGGRLPMCQDTGTAIVFGKKGQRVWVEGDEEAALSEGVAGTYRDTNLRYSQMAPLTMFDEVNTGNNLPRPVRHRGRPRRRSRRRVPPDVHRQGRRLGQQDVPVPGDAGAAGERGQAARMAGHQDQDARHLGLPALPPGGGDRRAVGRAHAQDGEARLDALSRRLARDRRSHRARVPRPRPRGEGPCAHAESRHRRAVRGKIFLPRRARGAAAAPRGEPAGGDRRVLLGGPADPCQDHARWDLPRAARDRSVAVPSRDHRQHARGRGGACRSRSADERDPRGALPAPGQDAAVAERDRGGGPRHRAREDQGAARPRRGHAAIPARPPGLLRGSGEDARGHADRLLRSDHGGAHGQLCRGVSSARAARS